MKNTVRCKACGFLMGEGYDECPACGVPSKMFEPFDDKVPASRRNWLNFHFHPVIVHAPQAIAFLLFFLAAIYTILVQAFPGTALEAKLLPTVQVMAFMLPIAVLAGMLSGMVDGKVRYKKINTILLRRKIILGSLFLIFSVGLAIVGFRPGFVSGVGLEILFLGLNIAAFLCSMFLGLWGAALTLAVMPGPFPKKKKKA